MGFVYYPGPALIVRSHFYARPRSLGDTAHHLEELVEVNLSITVLVDLSDGLVELGLRVDVTELLASEKREKLTRVDLATGVSVEHLEGCLQVCLTQEGSCVHRCSQELCVVDSARVVRVSTSQDFNQLLAVLTFAKSVLQLFNTN